MIKDSTKRVKAVLFCPECHQPVKLQKHDIDTQRIRSAYSYTWLYTCKNRRCPQHNYTLDARDYWGLS